mmetsp:Transcript_18627/g.41021  ORF Transcript_18627/g.41021 Transcript_18627/m.41021 type:complete len:210 (-) Transcript_18627:844-1473(-)
MYDPLTENTDKCCLPEDLTSWVNKCCQRLASAPGVGGFCQLPWYPPPVNTIANVLASGLEVAEVEVSLKYTFKNSLLLVEALTHPSAAPRAAGPARASGSPARCSGRRQAGWRSLRRAGPRRRRSTPCLPSQAATGGRLGGRSRQRSAGGAPACSPCRGRCGPSPRGCSRHGPWRAPPRRGRPAAAPGSAGASTRRSPQPRAPVSSRPA